MNKRYFQIFLLITLGFLTVNAIYIKGPKNLDFIRNCPSEFTYDVFRDYIEKGSMIEAQKLINSLGLNEKSILYGLTPIYLDTDVSTLKITLPDLNSMDSEISKKFYTFLSYGYLFDCKDIKISTKFLFWLIRHLDIQFLPATIVLSIIKYIFKEAGSQYGHEFFIPSKSIKTINLSEILMQNKNDEYPSISQINKAIKLFTSTDKFIDANGALELPDLKNLLINSIENKRLRSRIYLLQKGDYSPNIREKSQIQSVRYILRTSRYYLDRYISPEIAYNMWSIVYNAITGLNLSEFRSEMIPFLLKKSYSDTWPHEADVLDAISVSLRHYGIRSKNLSIHSKWYAKLKKEGYMLTIPENTKTSRWFCRFFQHYLQIFITPYLQYNIWKTTLENLLEPFAERIIISNDKCFYREDPEFPWPTCHKVAINDPNYIHIEHDKVLDHLSYEFARIIHNFNPGYPFHDICEVTKILISSESYRREVRQPKSKIKHSMAIRRLERINYLENIVKSYKLSKKYEPFIEPSNEVMFFFKYYIENDIEIDNKIIKKVATQEFMDEDLEDIVKTRNFVIDCAKVYSSLPSRELWNDKEIQEIPPRGKKAIITACSNLFYSKPKCKFESIPSIHPARESSNILSGEFSLRIFSFFRSIGILNVTPEEFCDDSIYVLSRIFNIKPRTSENTKKESLKRERLYEKERFLRNKLIKFKTLNNEEYNRSKLRKMNEMMEQIVKSKIQERLKPKKYYYLTSNSNRPLDFSKREDGSEWELDELQDIIRLGNKFVFYTSFKQFPTRKFRITCNKILKNIILKIEGNSVYLKRKKHLNPKSKLTDDKISDSLTKDLCFSLGNWQQSIKKRAKNFIEFLWLKMNNHKNEYKNIDTSSIPVPKYADKNYCMKSVEPNVQSFYNNLSLNLKQKFPQFEIKVPNTKPLEPEILKLKKLGYECPPPKSIETDAIKTAEECIKYLYRYGLYILNGIVFDLEVLYKVYSKSFRDSGFEVIAFLPNVFTQNLKKSLVKTNIFDYNFHRYETLCSLNDISSNSHWEQLFKVVESISKDMITNLHTSNIILPGTSNSLLLPKRTSINYICEFVLNLLNPNNFLDTDTQINDFFNKQIVNTEYKRGLIWHDITNMSSSVILNSTKKIGKKITRSLYTIYFVQSCIHSIMKQFAGFHYILAAMLCRKTKEWRTCDEPTHAREDYLSDINIGDSMEEYVLKRLLKGTFVDMVTFELQEKSISYFWTKRSLEVPENKLPISYVKFCPVSLRIHNYLQSGRFKTFLEACTFALETDHLFRKEVNGEIYTIKRSIANEICSNTYWGQECSHPTIRESALFFYEKSMEIMQIPTHTIPLSYFCNLAYEMAFNKDPVNFCFRPHTFEGIRSKTGVSSYFETSPKKNEKSENYRTRKWDVKEMNPENIVLPSEDPNGMLGHIIKTHNYNNVYIGDLRSICERSLVAIRDCSKIPSFSEKYPNIVNNPELLRKVNEESLRLFFPLIKKKNPKLFEDVPLRIATFVEICQLAVSTFDITQELFNTACVASFGWDKFLDSKLSVTKYTDWSNSILFCSSVSKWKSCSNWSTQNQKDFKNMELFQLADAYLKATPLQKAVVDFMSIFFTSNISLFLSGANTQSISNNPKDQKYISYLRKKHDLFCPASIEILLKYSSIKIENFSSAILSSIRSNEISYSKIRNLEAQSGTPYIFFNIDCPEILSKHISNLIETITNQNEDFTGKTQIFGFKSDIPDQWEKREYILEFSVRVCKKYFSWKNCLISKEVLENYTPIEINTFEYVASYMYFKYITAELISKKTIFNEEQKIRPIQNELNIFCKLSMNVITQHPKIMKRDEIEFVIKNTLPSNMKKYHKEITNAFVESHKIYTKGTQYLRGLKVSQDSNKFSFA